MLIPFGKAAAKRPPAGFVLAGGLLLALLITVQLLWIAPLQAAEIHVKPGRGSLQAALDAAQEGDVLLLGSGRYAGSIIIRKSLELQGVEDSIIDGEGSGHVITVDAPDVMIQGVSIRHSGNDLNREHSGIFLTDRADRARIRDNHLQDNLIGIYLKGPEQALIEHNTIIGSRFHRMNDRGNGVYVWNSPGSVVQHNDIRYGRDGIFVTTSRNNRFRANRMRELRFAVHYMYTHDSEIVDNISIDNHVGYALMFSDRISARGNVSHNDRQRGLFFNYANYSQIEGNRVSGAEKCVFIYNANHNRFHHNRFEECRIGIHFTAGSENNEIHDNAFINNRSQVKYVGTRYIKWSKQGRGNYWSDNTAFDIDRDGIADQIYRPNDLVDQIVWRHPLAKLLLNSPSVQIIKWAQAEFPGLHPGGVTDSAPLMQPPSPIRSSVQSQAVHAQPVQAANDSTGAMP